MKSLFKHWHRNFSFQILISMMKSQFQNPNFSHEIAVSLFESEFKFLNPNLIDEITVSLFQSEFQHPNPNFIDEIAISALEPHFQYYYLTFHIRNQDFNFVICLYQFSILVWSTFIFVIQSFFQRTSFSYSIYLSFRFVRRLWSFDIYCKD